MNKEQPVTEQQTQSFQKHSVPESVVRELRALVTGPQMSVGDRLVPMRELCKRLGTSLPTVQRALNQLQAEGLVEKRHGSGVFVADQALPLAMNQCVTLCANGFGHVWSELTLRLMEALHSHQMAVTLVSDVGQANQDQAKQDQPSSSMIRSIYNSSSPCMIVRGNQHFAFDALRDLIQRPRPIVGVVDWDSDFIPPGLVRVLSDSKAGGRMVAEHLLELGHRHVLVVGSATQIYHFDNNSNYPPMIRGFRKAWEAAGGRIETCSGPADQKDGVIQLDSRKLKHVFSGSEQPTAVFGLMDVAVCDLHYQLRSLRPELADVLAYVGYFNTPWAQAARPAMTSVDLNIQQIVEKTWKAVHAAVQGKKPPFETSLVKPKLVIRQTSRRAGQKPA